MAEPYKEVELLDGSVVRVHRPPTQRIIAIVEKKHPRPLPPIRSDKTVTGRTVTMRIDDDPDYLDALARWEAKTNEEIDRMGSLFVFKDLQVPDTWDITTEVGAEMAFLDPEWKPREGEMGRKLDYIEWVIYGDVVNKLRVTEALRDLSGIDMQEVQANEASFRPQVEGEATE